jgi:hypothetical protein
MPLRPLRHHALASPLVSALVASLTTLLVVGTLGASGAGQQQILAELQRLEGRIDALSPPGSDPVFGLQLCIKGGVGGEVGASGENDLKVEGEGRVGAEAFGNGAMAKAKGGPSFKLEGAVKGEAGGELTACFDLRALAQRIQALHSSPSVTLRRRGPNAGNPTSVAGSGLSSDAEATLLRLASVDPNQLLEVAASFVDATALDPAALPAALEHVRDLPLALDSAHFGKGEAIASLAAALPLPAQQRALLLEPGILLDALQQQQALCSQQDLPPRLAGMVGRACAAAANEPLQQALLDVDTRMGAVQGSVSSLSSQVGSLPGRVKDALCSVLPGC